MGYENPPWDTLIEHEYWDRLIDEEKEKAKLLPAWFIPRMMAESDYCIFGLMMENGNIIGITKIYDINEAKNGDLWLDVAFFSTDLQEEDLRYCASRKTKDASINASHILAAFEWRQLK